MINDFKKLSKHSTIYTIGTLLSRAAAFLLIPLYTHILSPSDYGTLEIFYVTSTVLQTFLGMMIAHAALRFYFEYEEQRERNAVISTSFLATFGISLVTAVVLWQYVSYFSVLIFQTAVYGVFFKLIFSIIILEISKEVCLAFFRAREYSVLFISVSLLQLLSQIGLNLYFVVILRKGIFGILLGNMLSTTIVWVFITAITVKMCGLAFHMNKLKEMFYYSYPFVLASAGTVIINNSDRFFLKKFSSLAIVGLYALGYKFGMLMKALLIDSFAMSYGPFRFSIMKNHNAKEIYARVMTYFVFVAAMVSLFITLLAKDILHLVSKADFRDAYKVVPIIMFTFVCIGMTYIFQTGIFMVKKTKYVFFITTVAAVLVIIIDFLLIPRFHMFGAAVAQLLTNVFIMGATWNISQKLYPIKYEFARILKIFIIVLLIYIISVFIKNVPIIFSVLLKFLLVFSFPFVLFLFNFYEKKELDILPKAWRKMWTIFSLKLFNTQTEAI